MGVSTHIRNCSSATLTGMHQDGIPLHLGKALRRRREELGLTQRDCAKLADVHVQTVRNMELGNVRSSRSFAKICKALKVRPERVLREAEKDAGGVYFPAVGQLTRVLMEMRKVDADELAEAMIADDEDVQRLLDGDAGGPLLGAAAVALAVPWRAYDIALTEGFKPALLFVRRTSDAFASFDDATFAELVQERLSGG